jgi:hypothetical protein
MSLLTQRTKHVIVDTKLFSAKNQTVAVCVNNNKKQGRGEQGDCHSFLPLQQPREQTVD